MPRKREDKRDQILLIGVLMIVALMVYNAQAVPPDVNPAPSPTWPPGGGGGTQPTPIPTSTPYSQNLVVVPDSFMGDINGASKSYASVDYSVTRDGRPSIKLTDDTVRGTREVNTIWPRVKPGDRIVWRVWCKTSSYPNTVYTGGRVGVDFCGAYGSKIEVVDGLPRDYETINGQLCSGNKFFREGFVYPENHVYPNVGNPPVSQFKVPWGTSDWTLIYLEFTVPSTTYYYTDGHAPTQITHVTPWIDARELTGGVAWFADSEFYIYPGA